MIKIINGQLVWELSVVISTRHFFLFQNFSTLQPKNLQKTEFQF